MEPDCVDTCDQPVVGHEGSDGRIYAGGDEHDNSKVVDNDFEKREESGVIIPDMDRFGGVFDSKPNKEIETAGAFVPFRTILSLNEESTRNSISASQQSGSDDIITLRRTTNSLLNKLTIEKFPILAEKLASVLDEIRSAESLNLFVGLILDKVLREPDFSEMYADLWQVLVWRCPLPQDEVQSEASLRQANPLNKLLLAQIQDQYLRMPRNLSLSAEEAAGLDQQDIILKEKKRRQLWMGIINLIGELFKRRLLPIKILQAIVVDLVIHQVEPQEHFVECFCQLICTAGYFVESTPKFRPLLDAWFGRLAELQQKKNYSKRLLCIMQDVVDLRKARWRKKIHKERAKALNELRAQLETEQFLGGSIHAAQLGNIIVVGQRTNLQPNTAYAEFVKAQENLYLAKIAKLRNNIKPSSH